MADSALLSPTGVAAYPALFSAKLSKNAKPSDKPKFSMTILFDEAALATPEYKAMMQAVYEAGVLKWGKERFDAMVREDSWRSPFRKEVVTKGFPANFQRFVNITSGQEYPPAVIDTKGAPIRDPRGVISGTLVRASLGVRAYGGPGTEYGAGIAIDLRNVQKMGEGSPLQLGGSSDANSDFGVAAPQTAPDIPLDRMMA